MRIILTVLSLITLCSCDRGVYADWSREKTAERADIADANARTSLAQIEEMKGEIEDLTEKVEALEARATLTEKNTGTLFENAGPSLNGWQTDAIDRLYANDRIFAARTGLPFEEKPSN